MAKKYIVRLAPEERDELADGWEHIGELALGMIKTPFVALFVPEIPEESGPRP